MEYIDDTMEQVREEQRLEAKESKAQTLEHRSDITNSITAEQIARLFEETDLFLKSTSTKTLFQSLLRQSGVHVLWMNRRETGTLQLLSK